MSAETVTTYVVQYQSGERWIMHQWHENNPPSTLEHARRGLRILGDRPLRIVERRVTTIEEVVP